jgi:hypothetical protein
MRGYHRRVARPSSHATRRRRSACGCVVASLLMAQTALAGDGRDNVEPVGEAPPDDPAAEANAWFGQGREAFMDGHYEDASALFRRSYALRASPNTRLMIAKSLMEAGEPVEAYAEMTAALREAEAAAAHDPKYQRTSEEAREDLERLQGRVARIRLKIAGAPPPGTIIRVGDRELARDAWSKEVIVAPGMTTVTLQAADGSDQQVVSLEPGSQKEVALIAPAPDEPASVREGGFEEHQRTLAYVVGGVGAAGMVVFAVFGALTLTTFADLEERCPTGACPRGTQSDIDLGETYQTVANVGAVVGAVGLTAGVLLWVLHPDVIGQTEPERAGVSLKLGLASVALSGELPFP